MKNLICLISAFCVVFCLYAPQNANAQFIQKGAIMAGGNASFQSVKPDGSDSYSILQISPQVGYFVIDNLAIGADLSFAKTEGFSSIGAGVFGRYYTNVGVFGQAGFKYLSSSLEILGDKTTTSGNVIDLGIGYAAFLNSHVSLEPIVKYSIQSGDIGKANTIGLGVGFQVYLGK